jgi:hypothetical protein
MRYIVKVVREVERVYTDIDVDALHFRAQSGLKCLSGCSSCCTFKNIKASVLEMMPLAWHLYMNNLHQEVIDRLDQGRSMCALYQMLDTGEGLGRCLYYDQRALICRLFGNAGITIKQSRVAIYTCQTMKYADQQLFNRTLDRIQSGMVIPMAQDYQTHLDVIDFALASDIHLINQSIRKAMEKVSFHFRRKPSPHGYRRVG